MRSSLKKPKPKAPTILQQESTKLKQKLQLLREQVIQKKQQKQMNKTATSLQSNIKPLSHNQQQNKMLSQTMKVNTSQFPDNKLHNLLIEVKLESLQDKLKQKGIKTFDKFIQLNEQQIDEWKDIAVGWRIKLKKQIRISKQKKQINPFGTSESNWNNSKSTQNNINNKISSQFSKKDSYHKQQIQQPKTQQNRQNRPQQKRQKNIEDIIKQRKQDQIFVPISRQIQQINQQQENYQQQMTQQDQDVIIQSFMKVFQPRKGIINKCSKFLSPNKKQKTLSKQKNISWAKSVQQLQKQFMKKNHKTYPKQSIVKQALISMHDQKIQSSQSLPQDKNEMIKYCWKCFRKIDIKQNIGFRMIKQQSEQGVLKYFCSQRCKQLYGEQMDEFVNNIGQQGQRQQQNGNILLDRQRQRDRLQEYRQQCQQQQQLQIIDLSII